MWTWYDWRRTLIAKCRPNAAHETLARWSRRDGFTLITQNVDGLHEFAGTRDVVRFHGSIWEMQCAAGCANAPRTWEDRSAPLTTLPPQCPACCGVARPAVMWFGEAIDPHVLARCAAALDCDVFLSIGTSSIVHPAAGLLLEARERGAFTAEVNPEATEASGVVDVAIPMGAEEALPAIDRLLTSWLP